MFHNSGIRPKVKNFRGVDEKRISLSTDIFHAFSMGNPLILWYTKN